MPDVFVSEEKRTESHVYVLYVIVKKIHDDFDRYGHASFLPPKASVLLSMIILQILSENHYSYWI